MAEDGDLLDALPEARVRDQLPQEDAHREDVGASVDLRTEHLLGGHVPDAPLELADLGLAAAIVGLRDAEIEQNDAPIVGEKDVLGRHIAVDDVQRRAVQIAEGVRVGERAEHVRDDPEAVFER